MEKLLIDTQAALQIRYGIPEISLQVGATRFRIFKRLKNMSRVENSNPHGALAQGCNVLLIELKGC